MLIDLDGEVGQTKSEIECRKQFGGILNDYNLKDT